MTSQSAVLVGGGHNGLVCATYLARAGYKVQILEARETVGGAASTISFAPGYQVSGLAHILHSLSPKVCRDLNLPGAGPGPWLAIDTISLDRQGHHLTLGENSVSGQGLSDKDLKAYPAFKQEFLSYAEALEPLMMNKPPRLKDMDLKDKLTLARLGWKLRFGLGAGSMREFLRVGGINIFDVLNEIFDDERLKGAIATDAIIGHHMGPRTPTTVLTYLLRLRGEIGGAAALPLGGMGQIARMLSESAQKAGVVIRTSARVKRILVDDGRASGVELETGELVNADLVISNADAKNTFLNLVGTQELDAMFARRIHTTRTNGNVAKIHLALNGLPSIEGLSTEQLSQRLIVAPSMRYLEHAFNHAKYGEYSEHPVLEITIPSITDPELAPSGHHVMSICASFAPYHLKNGWQQDDLQTGLQPDLQNRLQEKERFLDKVTALISDYAPGFASRVVASQILTPVDIEAEYNITGGHWHHGEMTIDQSFMMRPVHGTAQYDTPIDGLFLCGAAAHPGGGVTGIPGHNAAQRILAMGAR
ncbi:MAG: NAD(P)/FAD-dependent oxidoreductase [bacterium]|nr:NAD(P)/FAD-dependent oxidoreductase [Gammaproteobacteria bacterium]